MKKRIGYLLFETDSAPWAMVSGTAFLLIGLFLFIAGDTFATSISYNAMAGIAPEWAWGAIFTAIGGTQMWATLKEFNWRKQAVISMVAVFLWLFWTFMILLANPLSTGIVMYSLLALVAFGRYFRCRLDKERL